MYLRFHPRHPLSHAPSSSLTTLCSCLSFFHLYFRLVLLLIFFILPRRGEFLPPVPSPPRRRSASRNIPAHSCVSCGLDPLAPQSMALRVLLGPIHRNSGLVKARSRMRIRRSNLRRFWQVATLSELFFKFFLCNFSQLHQKFSGRILMEVVMSIKVVRYTRC